MTDREVMQQALEALESGLAFSTHSPVLQNLRAALEQQQAEPVAYCYVKKGSSADALTFDQKPADAVSGTVFPLYTAPPQRKPLTIKEVEQILAQHDYELHGDRARYIVRMTEEAHGIKGEV